MEVDFFRYKFLGATQHDEFLNTQLKLKKVTLQVLSSIMIPDAYPNQETLS
jgi:hypothetical protein